jgi:pimeloyl-ACP methyl ester carboxylesterase
MMPAILEELFLTILNGLKPWEYRVKDGFTVRGFYTPPTGKPLLHFIHGNGFCGLTYEHLLAELQSDFDLFISDAQGHGESDAGGEFKGWDKSASLFIKVWREYASLWDSVPRFALGHSFGAVMSTLMMARAPDLFAGGLLMDPVYAPPRMAQSMSILGGIGLLRYMPLARQARIRTRSWPSYQAAWDYLHQRGTFKGWQDACLTSYLDHALSMQSDGSMHLKCPPEIEAGIFASYPKQLWQAIQAIQQPMALFYGCKTYPFVLESLPRIHKANAHYDFIEVAGGHCFMQEQPVQTAAEIKAKVTIQLAYL